MSGIPDSSFEGPSDVQGAGAGLVVGRADGTIVDANEVLCSWLGLPRERLVGQRGVDVGLADPSLESWVLGRQPLTGEGYRYRRHLVTTGGRLRVDVTLNRITVAGDELLVATYAPVASGASEADVLGAVVEEAPIGFIVLDSDLRVVRINHAVEELGRLRPEHLGRQLTAVLPDVSAGLVQGLAAVLAEGAAVDDLEVTGAGGRVYSVNLFPIHDNAGAVSGAGCVFADITTRAQAERSAQELAAIITSSRDAILRQSLDGTIESWNGGAERLYGYTAAEAVGRPVAMLEADSTRGETTEMLRRIAAGETFHHFETERRHKDGRVVIVSISVSPVHDGRGLVIGASVVARDVSDRRLAEARNAAIVAGALDAIVTMDEAGRIIEFNPAGERIFGYAADDVVGRTVADAIVPPELRDAHRRGLAAYLETGDGPLIGQLVEVTAMRADGSLFPAEISIVPTDLPTGRAFTAHIRDIAQRRASEEALAASQARRREILRSLLQAEEYERSRIATELHDDTVQVMTASLLTMDRAAIAANKAGVSSVAAAIELARATLEEATERTRRLMFELRPAILHERGLQSAVEVLAAEVAREAGAEAVVRCNSGRYDPHTEELVYRTVQEALANTRKHAHAHRIEVMIDEREGTLYCRVDDDGRGFDPDDVRGRPRAALHLGLDSLAERIRAAGGDVDIASGPGQGTHLRFSVPLSDAA